MEPQHPNLYDLGTHPVKDTIRLITALLEKVISVNDIILSTCNDNSMEPPKNTQQQLNNLETGNNHGLSTARRMSAPNIYTRFHARALPNISIQAYLTRILKYCPCTNECFLALLVYFDRMAKPDPPARTIPLRIDSYNVHRFIISGIMIASKLFSDVFFTNARYAKVGGLPVSELNVLEIEFLALNEYKLFVTIEEFQYYGDQLLLHRIRDHENGMGMAIHGSGNVDTKKYTPPIATTMPPLRHTVIESHNANTVGMSPSFRNQKEYESNSPQTNNQMTRPLTIGGSSIGQSVPLTHSHSTPTMKDLNRKSDEIDRHRLFKRPSSRAINTIRDPISTHRHFDFCSTTPSTTSPSKLPTLPSVSPSSYQRH